MKLSDYFLKLKKSRLKVTPKRAAIIGLFLARRYLSPFDVHRSLRSRFSRLGLPSIYRNLEELVAARILTKVSRQDRQLYYALCTLNDCDHHHFICRKCRKVEEVEFCNFKGVSSFIEKNLGAKVEAHQLQIEGLCSRCR